MKYKGILSDMTAKNVSLTLQCVTFHTGILPVTSDFRNCVDKYKKSIKKTFTFRNLVWFCVLQICTPSSLINLFKYVEFTQLWVRLITEAMLYAVFILFPAGPFQLKTFCDFSNISSNLREGCMFLLNLLTFAPL